ncbi:MAG: hypothetical protein Q8O04_09740 [Deltaproteobacteria bacterium]|nr:hypothetical protein [Deltaproteobacteria bacterium]
MNADRFKYKEITDIILRSFKAENQNSKDLYMIIKEKISAMISVDRRLSSYKNNRK